MSDGDTSDSAMSDRDMSDSAASDSPISVDLTNGSVPKSNGSANRLECSGVTVRFGGLLALSDVDLEVPPATIVGLVGPNGAGKSTLFGVLSGLLTPTAGQVRLDGQDVTSARPQLRAERGLARTFQHPELFAGLTVRQHMVLAHRIRTSKRRVWSDLLTMGSIARVGEEERTRVDGLIRLLGLESIADRPALGLPLGSARLVELGRVLATSPTVLLMDEPSSGLDSTETGQFEETLLRASHDRGISILLVEHDVEMVMRLCERIYVLDFGAMIASGSSQEIRQNPAVRAAYLGEEVTGTEGAGDSPEAEVAEGARRLREADPLRSDGDQTRSLVVENLTVHYGDAVALSDVSLKVGSGRVLAVLGPNGAGKSSLARAVSGLVHPSGGKVLFGAEDISSWSAHRIRRAGLIHLPEGRGVFRALSVVDNLRMAASSVQGRQARKAAIELAYDIFPVLGERRRQIAGTLSGGEQQMLSLARALATGPGLIVADELSLGLAPMMVDLVFDGLTRARQAGVSIIMIEQYVHRALAFADDCLVLSRGKVAWSGPASEAGSDILSQYLGEAMAAAT